MIVLIVAVYTSLGGQFDTKPHEFATFKSMSDCEAERQHVESRSFFGTTWVAVCVPRS